MDKYNLSNYIKNQRRRIIEELRTRATEEKSSIDYIMIGALGAINDLEKELDKGNLD